MSARPLPPRCARRTPSAGFTLIELLIATAIGAGIMVSLAALAHVFTEQVSEAASGDQRLEQAVSSLAQEVRTAWAVAAPSASRLQLHDPLGRVTEYFLEDGALRVARPSGAEGTLLAGVAAFDLSLRTRARLRDATPETAVQTCWTAPASAGAAGTLVLNAGQSLAIGFSLPVTADASFHDVPGVAEQVRSSTPTRLLLPAARLDASNKQLCHLHASQPHNPSHAGGQGTLTLEVYEARVPLDARPLGARLASATVSVAHLPAAAYHWWDTSAKAAVTPPGGVAWGWWDGHPQVVLQSSGTPSQAAIDLTGLHATLLPGRAYTLVLTVAGWDGVIVPTRALASARLSGVALRAAPGGSWSPQAQRVPCSLEANQSITQTMAATVVTGVELAVRLADGRSAASSANVAGQIAVDDPWLGALPGELPELQLAGS